MKLGCCLNMLGNSVDPIGAGYIPALASSGYDYVELPLAQVMELPEEEFESLLFEVERSGVSCECCNNFFPASIRLTGEMVNKQEIESYVEKAIDRAKRLGAKVIVFGSGGAKNVPEGFDTGRAFDQIAAVLKLVQPYALAAGICIVIEPLNRMESNIIRTLKEGKALMDAADASSVKLLVDYYHFSMEEESLDALKELMPYIRHVHFAKPEGRRFPLEPDKRYGEFFEVLKNGRFTERVSIEAYSDEPEEEIKKVLFLKKYFYSL